MNEASLSDEVKGMRCLYIYIRMYGRHCMPVTAHRKKNLKIFFDLNLGSNSGPQG